MLPYRRRPPVYGGKLGEKKKQEAEAAKNINALNGTASCEDPSTVSDPLHGGGPVQRAIEIDLLELRAKFSKSVKDEDAVDGPGNDDEEQQYRHVRRGRVFGIFKSVFGEAKIALLHSRVIPPRCERDAYSQIIYAACLSLLKKSFEEATLCLEHAIFAVFCLYTLYQTNPLPTGPDVDNVTEPSTCMSQYDQQRKRKRDLLSLLPMGLQSLENPKALYRRAFRNFIRIDRYHYSLLLRLVEECRALQAECQSHGLLLQQQEGDDPQKQHTWRCQCGVATDGIEIVGRVMETLDLVEYTGPCSVEGLVGHADYPLSSATPPNTETRATSNGARDATVMTSDEIDQGGASILPFQLSETFFPVMSDYRDKVQSIRLPPLKSNLTTSESRIRKALAPMFGDKVTPWAKMYEDLSQRSGDALFSAVPNDNVTTTRRINRNVVTFQTETRGGPSEATTAGSMLDSSSSVLAKNTSDAPGLSPADENVAYEIVFPSGLPTSTQEGLDKAIQSILTRFPTAWKEKEVVIEMSGTVDPWQEDVSTLDDGVSAMSQATGPGRAALRNLLSRVAAAGASSSKANAFSVPPSDQEGPLDEDNESSASQLTGPGRAALRNLLATVTAPRSSTTRPTARSAQPPHSSIVDNQDDDALVASQITGPGRAALRNLLANVTAPRASTTRPTARTAQPQHPSIVHNPDDDASAASQLTGPGRAALRNLLATVTAARASSRSMQPPHRIQDEDVSVASQITGQGRAALRKFLTNVAAGRESDPEATAFSVQPSDKFLFGNLDEYGNDRATSKFPSGDKDEPSDLSDPSEDELSDDVSTAVSTVGRRALHSLLSAVSEKPLAKRKKAGNKSTNKGAKRKPSDKADKNRTSAFSNPTRKRPRRNILSTGDAADELLPSRDTGRAALEELLSRVAFRPETKDD